MIDLTEVGAHIVAEGPLRVRFGLLLPTVTWPAGYRVKVLVIHERDQFVREVPPREFYLDWGEDSAYDLWSADVQLNGGARSPRQSRHLRLPLSATAGDRPR